MLIKVGFLDQFKYAEFDIVINSYTAEPGYWQNYVIDILATNDEDSSAATIESIVKYAIYACIYIYIYIYIIYIH